MVEKMVFPKFSLEEIEGNSIYHYTNIKGVSGILKDNCFHLTQCQFLNDYMEIDYTKNLLEEICTKKSDTFYNELFSIFLSQYNFYSNSEIYNIYVMSFSSNPDSLTLWSEYSDYTGYCIQFDKEKMKESFLKWCKNENWEKHCYPISGKVNYNRKSQIKLLEDCIDDIKSMENNKDYTRENLFDSLIHNLIMYSIFFKNPLFEHEEEYRIAIQQHILPQLSNSNNVLEFKDNGISLKPYIKVKCGEDSFTNKVIIGPQNTQDISERGLKIFLHALNKDHIEVKQSDITLRKV